MKIRSGDFEITLSFKEITSLTKLLGKLSPGIVVKELGMAEAEEELLANIYYALAYMLENEEV